MSRTELSATAALEVREGAVTASAAELEALTAQLAAQEPTTFMAYGRECTMRRKMLFFGEGGYRFSGQTCAAAAAMDPVVQRCLAAAQEWLPGANAALVNLYKDGNEYISAHRDNEAQHAAGSPILTFSFGAVRTFRIRKWEAGKSHPTLHDAPLPSHSVAVMHGMQQHFTHEIPVQRRVTYSRLSVTVRQFA